jgi:nucleoid DNA-binding protein
VRFRLSLIVNEVWQSQLLTKKVSTRVLDEVITATFGVIKEAIANGEVIRLADFGTFCTKSIKQRNGRNPKTGEPIIIPAKISPHFKASKHLKDLINKEP